MTGVYKISNIVSQKDYIGSSSRVHYRLGQHRSDLRGGRHVNSYLQNSWNKHGEDAFTFEVIEECDNHFEREQYWIDELGPEFNILPVAGSAIGYTHTEEAINKIVNASKKQWAERRDFMLTRQRESRKNNPDRNRRRTETLIKQRSGKYQGVQLINQDGDVITINGSVKGFARDNGLHYSTLHNVLNNKATHVKGWMLNA